MFVIPRLLSSFSVSRIESRLAWRMRISTSDCSGVRMMLWINRRSGTAEVEEDGYARQLRILDFVEGPCFLLLVINVFTNGGRTMFSNFFPWSKLLFACQGGGAWSNRSYHATGGHRV